MQATLVQGYFSRKMTLKIIEALKRSEDFYDDLHRHSPESRLTLGRPKLKKVGEVVSLGAKIQTKLLDLRLFRGLDGERPCETGLSASAIIVSFQRKALLIVLQNPKNEVWQRSESILANNL